MSFPAAEQDRLQAKKDKEFFSEAATWVLEGFPRGLFRGQLDSQLPASGPLTCRQEAVFPITPTLSSVLQSQEFPL